MVNLAGVEEDDKGDVRVAEIERWFAFFINTLRLFVNLTWRLFAFSIFFNSIFPLPIFFFLFFFSQHNQSALLCKIENREQNENCKPFFVCNRLTENI